MRHVSHSLEETSKIAGEWLGQLEVAYNKEKGAVIVGFSGHLGAGKTAFAQAVARHLGVEEDVTSPTFVIMKIYPLQNKSWKNLVHIDAYRLESGREIEALKFEQYASDPGNLIIIEWPENIKEALTDCSMVFFEAGEKEGERVISWEVGPR